MILESVILLTVENLNKNFKLYKKPSDRLFELFLRKKKHIVYSAISSLSFELQQGESLGVIGPNGAGKSTLMKLLTGLLISDSGKIFIDGKITGLIELGTGFNPELTGEVNIRNNALLLGMNDTEISNRFDAIAEFAEIGNYLNKPLKVYSSGMVMRLAFAVAIHSDPKCFLIDEALAVGDAYFQQKCTRKIMSFKENGGSLILVSHDMNAIKLLCDKVLLLNEGKCLELGEPESTVNSYNRLLAGFKNSGNELSQQSKEPGYGTLRASIEDFSFNGIKAENYIFKSGEKVSLKLKIRCDYDLNDLVVGFLIRDRFGQDVFGTNTLLHGCLIKVSAGDLLDILWDFNLNLGLGKYTLTVALHLGPDHTVECLHWADAICSFDISEFDGSKFIGICSLKPTLVINK